MSHPALQAACKGAAAPTNARPHRPALQRPQPAPAALQPALQPQLWQQASLRAASAALAALVAAAAVVVPPPPAHASVPLGAPDEDARRAWALSQLGGRYPAPRSASSAAADAPEPTSVRIKRLMELMAAGRAAEDAGNYAEALQQYDAVVRTFPDFATTEYARLARALMLYQTGRISDAILQLQDLEVSLRGYAEVHAALASILYVERPALLEVAEQQWEIAMEFNKQFADRGWVQQYKHWPPRLMAALDRFLALA